MNRPASLVSALFLLLIALAHVLRLLAGVEIVANGYTLPMWVSVPAAVFLLCLSVWLFRERSRSGHTPV